MNEAAQVSREGAAVRLDGMPVLEAKLHPPALRPEHMSRPDLLDMIDAGIERKLTLVDAPAGFGKSTLLATWCAERAPERRWAWFSVDEGDNDPVVFWTYVVHALRRVEPERFGAGLAALDRPGASLTRSVLPQLLNDLWTVDLPIALVMDDYHLVSEFACHESLQFFLRRLPPTLHLVIATRADPPIGLASMRARGDLTELRASHLRFTDTEVGIFLNDRLGLGLADDDLGKHGIRTEGWAAGLYLAALSLRGRDDAVAFIADFTGQHRHLVEYLSAEVLDRLSDEARAFLLETSVLDALTAPLCDAVTGRTDAAFQLRELRRTNQFLIALDEQGEWYRYHHLFQELLQLELERTAPEQVPALHARAAGWYQHAGDPIGAMRHALAEPDHARAGALFIAHFQRFNASGRFATIERWMDQLPETAILANPSLALAVAWIAAIAYRPKREVERWLVAAAATTDQPGPFPLGSPTLRSGVAIVRATFLFDDIGGAVQAGEEAVRVETDPTRHSYVLARSGLGLALYYAGRPAEARPLLEAALAAPLAHEQASAVTRVLTALAMVHLELGEDNRAEDLARRSVQHRAQSGLTEHPSQWTSSLALGMVLSRQGRFAEAEAVLAEGVEPRLPQLGDWRIPYAHALLALAPVRFARGHIQAAHALLDEARAAIAACPDPGMLPALLATTARSLRQLPHRATGLTEHLSESELRVLRLLATDLSQREIGRELYLSMNTVKTHTRTIYGKLGATSRADTIARARSLGLIA